MTRRRLASRSTLLEDYLDIIAVRTQGAFLLAIHSDRALSAPLLSKALIDISRACEVS